jgi:hypothetical protein
LTGNVVGHHLVPHACDRRAQKATAQARLN